ncbi:ABC-type transport auxiliary lipoprotein family protein [Burkholderia sp. L27(2015)]|uniref:ABC-type transport auxiliary lipoprotein family protein n=1 Tax=Burkholderia sp. L27(2015) TaxID=1641858 RepID=UPI00131B8325|nr:ABC-type transport auxiliary lipoprotein family protein [Burkholderia sp. L27(2015)]
MDRIALSSKRSGARRPAKRALVAAIASVLVGSLAGCMNTATVVQNRFDLGEPPATLSTASDALRVGVLVVPDVRAPSDLENDRINYRLKYLSDLESRSYTTSHWSMTPPQMLTQRLRNQLSQHGAVMSNLGSTDAPVLQVDLLKFEQVFDQIGVSHAVIRLRATLSRGGTVTGQHDFEAQAPAATADAAGGARALRQATDASIGSLIQWLAAQPLK